MKRVFALVVAVVYLVPLFALAQTVPVVTFLTPNGGQPPNVTVTPGANLPAVAITFTAGGAATIDSIIVQRVGSAADAVVTKLTALDTQNNTLGSATLSGGTATLPLSLAIPAGESRTVVIFATIAGDLTAYQGQFFDINITGINTSAVVNGPLPVFGAQFTLDSGVAKPTCQLSANPSSYTTGQTVTLVWNSAGATGGTITGLGSVGPSGQQGILPGGTGTITGTFTGPGGTGTCTAGVTFNPSNGSYVDPGTVAGGGSVSNSSSVSAPGSAGTNGLTGTQSNLNTPGLNYGNTGTGIAQVCTGLDCQICSFGSLGQKIINYIIGLSIPVAAVMFAWAGIMYFTSATSPANIDRAKAAIRVAFWGFLIAISAWLIVQTMLKFILTPQAYAGWNTIQCTSAQRPGTPSGGYSNFSTLLNNTLGALNTGAPPVSVGTNSVLGGGQGSVVDSDTGAFSNNASAGAGGTCKAGDLYSQGGNDVSGASCAGADGTVYDPTPYAGGANIAAAATAYTGQSTVAGPGCNGDPTGGQCACAWAVNNILTAAGVPTIDGNSVAAMQQQLDAGRGTLVANTSDSPDLSQVSVGNVVIWKSDTYSHVGIVTGFDSNNNPIVSSNSSYSAGGATFSSQTNINFNKNWQAQVYKVN